MIDRIAFTIGGRPVQWQRAGGNFGGDGKGARRFTPHNMRKAEKAMKDAGRAAMGNRAPFTGPVRLTVIAIYAVPKTWPKRYHDAARNGVLYHTSTPDLDNLFKLAGDSLNGVAYVDDCQVAEVMGRKRYGDPERTEVEVRGLGPEDDGTAAPPPTPAEMRRAGLATAAPLPLPPGRKRAQKQQPAPDAPPRLL